MKEINRRLPYAIDLLSLAMGAGLDFPGSVRQVVEKSGSPDDPVVEEFTLILQSLQLGRTRRQALEEFAQRAPVDSVVEFVGALVQAELRGNPVAEVLRIQAEVARRKRTVRAEEAAARAGVQMMMPLVLVFLCILILIVAPKFWFVAFIDFAIHITIDRAKGLVTSHCGVNQEHPWFWSLIGVDQALHHLTGFGLAIFMASN